MPDVQWIKIYVDMFSNKKIKFIRTLPEGSDILLCWIMLLTSAGKCNTNGFIFLTENIPYTAEMLSNEYDIPLNTVRLAIETFKKLNMIDEENGALLISSWGEYQSADRLERLRGYDKERKRLARQKTLQIPQDCPQDVLGLSKEMSDKFHMLELDKELDITNAEKNILHELTTVKEYPFDYKKDLEFIRKITIEFPQSDVLASVKNWVTWIIDHPLKKNSSPRSQIRNFVKPKSWSKKTEVPVQKEIFNKDNYL